MSISILLQYVLYFIHLYIYLSINFYIFSFFYLLHFPPKIKIELKVGQIEIHKITFTYGFDCDITTNEEYFLENVLKWSTDSDTNLTVVCRNCDVYRQQSGWCRYLYSILTHFLAFNISRFSFYINEEYLKFQVHEIKKVVCIIFPPCFLASSAFVNKI